MILYPAIDIRNGKVVRLREGDPDRQTVFSDDPVSAAERWLDQGSAWLHIVNLDGAFSLANNNGVMLTRAAEAAARRGARVQFGGGLRSVEDIARAFNQGASRVVLGTIALEQPAIVEAALAQHGTDAVCVALDSRDGKVTTHGWQQQSDQTPLALANAMAARGVVHALYTDIRRDGGMYGAAIDATLELAQESGLQVIASGGVSSLGDVRKLARGGAAGAVIGMALYSGAIDLREALAVAAAP